MSVPTPILQYNLSDATMRGLLPAGYTPLAYIEFTGTQYLNTGITFNAGTDGFEVECLSTDASQSGMVLASDSGGYTWLYDYDGTNKLSLYINSSSGQEHLSGPPQDLCKHHCLYINRKYYGDGIHYGTMNGNNTTGSVIKIGDYSGSCRYKGKIYYVRLWTSGTLSADLRPAHRDSDGVIGMYDLASRTFKTNAGSGTFIAGPPLAVGKGGGKSLPEEYLLVEYLESTGDLYINTTYTPQSNVTIKSECSLAITDNLPDNAFWGSYNTSSGYRSYPLCIYNNKPFYGNSTGNVGLNSGSVSLLTIGTFYTLCTENGPSSSNMKVNGTLIISQSSSNTIVNSVNYLMFARRHGTSGSNGNIQHKSKIKLQWLRHYEDGVIKFNFIPCYRKSDMKPGMYDVVNGVFYTNAGSGEFILGPSITNCYTNEPNAGSGTLLGFYTNLSGIYDSSKGWVADFSISSVEMPGLLTLLGTSTNFSFSVWFKRSSGGGWNTIWGCSGFELEGSRSGAATSQIVAYSWGQSSSGGIEYTLNEWHHLVMTRNTSESKFYLDGELKYTGSAGSIPNTALFLGAWQQHGSQSYLGQMTNMMLFNTALTAAQVKELYGQ